MKSFTTLIILFLFGANAWAQAPANFLEGTWEMVSQKLIYPDSTVDRGRFLGPSYKMLNSTHFAWGRQRIIDGEVDDEVFAGGGRYGLVYTDKDTIYTEYIEYHSSVAEVGLTVNFNCSVRDDTLWHHSGQIGNMRLEEVWRRVK